MQTPIGLQGVATNVIGSQLWRVLYKLFNFITMPKRPSDRDSESLDISFSKPNPQTQRQDERLKAEILRVQAIQKQRTCLRAWNLNQQDLCQFFTSYQLFPQNQFSLEMLLDSPKLKLIKSQGKIYFGEVERKQRHGWGLQLDKSGQVYEGQFVGNQKRGRAVQVYGNCNLYLGDFLNNKKHGSGIFYWFSLTPKHPKGSDHIEYYSGEWWGGLPDGSGVHTKINGDLYTGSLKNGLKHGQGEEIYNNGDRYKGQYINGLPEGYGEYDWGDGSSYRGDFKQGLRSGYGLWKAGRNRLECYQGQYTTDKKCGYGVYTWDNGWTYRGIFDNDFREGLGQLFDSNNNLKYQGQWEKGEQIGREHAKFQLYQEDNPEYRCRQQTQELSGSNLRTVQMTNRRSARILSSNQRYQSAQTYRQPYNRQEVCQYGTISHFAEQNLCRRPESFQKGRNSVQTRSIRIRDGQIGTKINRPLAPGPSAILLRNAKNIKSPRRF